MNRKFIFFINPIAGTKNKERLINYINLKCVENKLIFEILFTDEKGEYYFLQDKIRSENITDVIICGGDGTINHIAKHLIGIDINIGIIPVGSGNGLAFAAGIKTDYKKSIDVILKGYSDWIDGFYVNNHFSCMLSGLGFDAFVANAFLRKKRRGLFTYILICLRYFFISKSYPFEISFDHQKLQTRAFFISIANSNQFGNYVKIAPKAKLNDGLLDIIIVTKKNKIMMAMLLLKQVLFGTIQRGKDVLHKNKNLYYFQVPQIKIKNPMLAPIHIDGEPINTEEFVSIKIQSKAIKLLQPKPNV